jgi:xylulokinase
MSFLGIDVGTTGCKAATFSAAGEPLAVAYHEYELGNPAPGSAELPPERVWGWIRDCIREAACGTARDPVQALAVSSIGEAVVPMTRDRRILGPSLLMTDARGSEYLPGLAARMPDERLHAINGNTLGNHYTLTKLLWLRDHRRELYDRADHFLHWSGFVSTMLGAEPHVDRSLANRTLLFDVAAERWSRELLDWAGLDAEKLPAVVASGASVGRVPASVAGSLGLRAGALVVAGAHDQCANAVGCGAIEDGSAMCGMGTYFCIVPVLDRGRVNSLEPRCRRLIRELGLNLEHHAAPDRFVTFLYTPGGSIVRWYRDTFASRDRTRASQEGRDVYGELFAELPTEPGTVFVLPDFSAVTADRFLDGPSGAMAGLTLATPRGAILRGILEGIAFRVLGTLDQLGTAGIAVDRFCAVGGGSRSDAWVQLVADVFNRTVDRPKVTEAGALGAAIIAAVGYGAFPTLAEGCRAMVGSGRVFEPDQGRHAAYRGLFARWQKAAATIGSAQAPG